MITPTVGRVVWFTSSAYDSNTLESDQPLAAIVTYVHGERCVNLAVFDANGKHHTYTSVRLLQDSDEKPTNTRYCEWMPYQKGQAAKAEALERKIEKQSSD